jgi:hypothetical protein
VIWFAWFVELLLLAQQIYLEQKSKELDKIHLVCLHLLQENNCQNKQCSVHVMIGTQVICML